MLQDNYINEILPSSIKNYMGTKRGRREVRDGNSREILKAEYSYSRRLFRNTLRQLRRFLIFSEHSVLWFIIINFLSNLVATWCHNMMSDLLQAYSESILPQFCEIAGRVLGILPRTARLDAGTQFVILSYEYWVQRNRQNMGKLPNINHFIATFLPGICMITW